jgi:disulfide bond formation protein DsbB
VAETPIIRCDEASWRFLGLSFAGWNAVISAMLAGIAVYGAAKRR